MKRHAAMVSMKAKHRNLEIAGFLKVTTSFVCKVGKGLNEHNGDELATRKRKGHCQRLADSLRTPEFVRRVHGMAWHGMTNENPGSECDILPRIFKCLKEQQQYIRNVVHQDL
ncbi:unnamed protein product [Hymenolepis diminuta]|uniref:Uncharacterized protein n=1 Tax=Hymenolepis diminuta TaxID=6216 RepID=A0A564YWD6_HYMDI|nr:unnamed protein product [Hymenolepis diminuta]